MKKVEEMTLKYNEYFYRDIFGDYVEVEEER